MEAGAGRLADFRAAGVNRASLGVQALDADALTFLGRKHSHHEALAAVELAARTLPLRYSFDPVIYASPRPDPGCLGSRIETRPHLRRRGHLLALPQLTIEENTAFHTSHARGDFVVP